MLFHQVIECRNSFVAITGTKEKQLLPRLLSFYHIMRMREDLKLELLQQMVYTFKNRLMMTGDCIESKC